MFQINGRRLNRGAFQVRKKRKMDEQHLWAELSGVESAIKDLIERRGEIAQELTHKMIENEKVKQAAGQTA